MAKKKAELKTNKLTALEETKAETKKAVKPEKEKKPKETVGPKKKNPDDWKKSMVMLNPETKKIMLGHIAASDSLTTQSIFIDEAIKHFADYLDSNK